MPAVWRIGEVALVIGLSGCAQNGGTVAGSTPQAAHSPAESSPAASSPSNRPIPSPVPIGQPSIPPPPPTATPLDPNVPRARENAIWAFDAAAGTYLLFGGVYTSGQYNEFFNPLGDTWTWDGTSWHQLAPDSNAPVKRYSSGVAYDSVHRVVVLHSGLGAPNDTWTWTGSRWLLLGPTQSPPSVPCEQSMTWDSTHNIGLLYDSTGQCGSMPVHDATWSWDGTNWTQVPTTASPSDHSYMASIAYDSARKMAVYFGHVNSGVPSTWTFDGNKWTEVSTSGSGSTSFVMASDDFTSTIVLYGDSGDTWTWDGSKWSPANPVHSPGARHGMSMTYDSTHHVVALFGGSTGTNTGLVPHNDIWDWDGSDWTKVSGS